MRLGRLAVSIAVVALAIGALVPGPRAQGKSLEDLMMDLNIAPLEPQAAPTLSVTTIDGGRQTLADLKGQAVLVYFMATW
jgi:cytochrome oxidase Cu insertion factor (SCO1/SenC/PrrC family)